MTQSRSEHFSLEAAAQMIPQTPIQLSELFTRLVAASLIEELMTEIARHQKIITLLVHEAGGIIKFNRFEERPKLDLKIHYDAQFDQWVYRTEKCK